MITNRIHHENNLSNLEERFCDFSVNVQCDLSNIYNNINQVAARMPTSIVENMGAASIDMYNNVNCSGDVVCNGNLSVSGNITGYNEMTGEYSPYIPAIGYGLKVVDGTICIDESILSSDEVSELSQENKALEAENRALRAIIEELKCELGLE